jgi:hypothetical protein
MIVDPASPLIVKTFSNCGDAGSAVFKLARELKKARHKIGVRGGRRFPGLRRLGLL